MGVKASKPTELQALTPPPQLRPHAEWLVPQAHVHFLSPRCQGVPPAQTFLWPPHQFWASAHDVIKWDLCL